MIEINGLKKSFGKQEVLKGIDLNFNTPGITAILGPNGSGKTTMIKCILGMVNPSAGIINFNGTNVDNEWQYRNDVSYLPQIGRFPENSKVKEIIHLIKSIRPGAGRDNRLIEMFDLEPHLNKRLKELSGGFRQKLNITLSMMYDSPVIILDEPSTGLDPVSLIRFKDFLHEEKQNGKIILLITHIMSLVEDLADQIVFMLEGNISFNGEKSQLLKEVDEKRFEKAIAKLVGGNLK